jgi:hypothetical protein
MLLVVPSSPKCLADFIVEWTEIQSPSAPIEQETWIMYFDSSVMKEGAV